MPDDDQKTEIIAGTIGAGVLLIGLVLLCRKCFGATPLPDLPNIAFPAGVTGYGAHWQPNQAIQLGALRAAQDPPGIYIAILPAHVMTASAFFDNPAANSKTGVIFPTPAASPAFTQLLNGVTDNAPILSRLEGFIRYTYKCLDYINATQVGGQLCAALHNSQTQTWIYPSRLGCSTGADGGRCSIAQWVRDKNMNLTQAEQQQLIALLQQTSAQQGFNAFTWLAQQINQMPLYSVYEHENQYPATFLTTANQPVSAFGLHQWFTTGNNCAFVQARQGVTASGVSIMDFIKNAVIILLSANSARNPAGGSRVTFDVHDWSQNTQNVPRVMNTMADRPPAIGLAHELIHAYHNQLGSQPGRDFGDFTTTLNELLCVGLGPWNQAPITENAIRAQWPPQGNFAADPLNLRQVAARDIYDDPGAAGAVAARQDGRI